MRIPFKVTNQIRDTLGWSDQLYQSLWDILIQANGLGFLLTGLGIENEMKKAMENHRRSYPNKKFGRVTVVKSEKANPVFDHVIRRTIPFYKPMEFVSAKHIMQGLPQLAIPGCKLSESTIRRVMIWLSPPHLNPGIFIKLNFRSNEIQTRIYGLNIPVVLRLLYSTWGKALEDNFDRKSYLTDDDLIYDTSCRIADIGWHMLEPCIKYCDNFSEAFDFMSGHTKNIDDIYDFCEEFKKYLPDTSELHAEFMEEREKIQKKIKRRWNDRRKRN